jgi:hypothetical protein
MALSEEGLSDLKDRILADPDVILEDHDLMRALWPPSGGARGATWSTCAACWWSGWRSGSTGWRTPIAR